MTESHTRWLAAQFKVIAWHRWFFLFNYIRNNNNKLCKIKLARRAARGCCCCVLALLAGSRGRFVALALSTVSRFSFFVYSILILIYIYFGYKRFRLEACTG